MNIYLQRGSETAPKCEASKIIFETLHTVVVLDFLIPLLPRHYVLLCFEFFLHLIIIYSTIK